MHFVFQTLAVKVGKGVASEEADQKDDFNLNGTK
jgi:hypothetical protein